MIWLLIALIWAHFLFDYPLQGDFLARAKNRLAPIPGVPWWNALAAHASIHAGAVAFLTGIIWLGLAELIAHFLIDDLKCRGRIDFNQDQAAHLGCKILWALIAWAFS